LSGIPSDAVVDDSAVYPPRDAARQFHDLRHEGTSRLFEAGLPIEKVALVTGHEDWRQLQRYTNLKVEDLLKLQYAQQPSMEEFMVTLASLTPAPKDESRMPQGYPSVALPEASRP
jgi:hypothetical protein